MTGTSETELAGQLLEAAVDHVMGELTGDRFVEAATQDLDNLLAAGTKITLRDAVDPDAVKRIAPLVLDQMVGNEMTAETVAAFSDAIYDLAANDEHHLGDFVDREPVAALVRQVLSMRTAQDRLLERLTESPLVATIASRLVSNIVGDFLATNRQRAEKIPGVSSMLKTGQRAASVVRSAGDRHLDQVLGDVAGRGAQYALRRFNSAIQDLIHEAPLYDAVLEVWDLHADEAIGGLRDYLSKEEQRDLALRVHDLVVAARNKPYLAVVIEECLDVFFTEYQDHTLTDLLAEFGLDRELLRRVLVELGPQLIEAARRDGVLEGLVRARLEPFFMSDRVLSLLQTR